METILLGRAGNQPFPITMDGVSGRHAQITIDGDNWLLEDLNSRNGTFIREENGEVRRITKMNITPMTFIYLGPTNSYGCSFYAHQVVKPGDFHQDFNYMYEKLQELETKVQRMEKLQKFVKLIQSLSMVLAISLAMIFQNMVIRIGITIVAALIPWLFNGSERKLRKKYSRFFACPNPKCTNILTDVAVERRRCPECRNKF